MNLQALARSVGEHLARRGWSLATAESCTGGLIGHCVTEIPGSSGYYRGGVIAYDNAIKVELLGVRETTLSAVGAVSETVASEMAAGVRKKLGASCGVSTTGIAGPGGATAEKPVGLVFIGVETPQGSVVKACRFEGDRSRVKQCACETALKTVLEMIAS